MRNYLNGVSYLPLFSPAEPAMVLTEEQQNAEAKKRTEAAGKVEKPATAAEVAAFQQQQQKETPAEGTGHNRPPLETPYVPKAHNRTELLAEIKEASEIVLRHDAAGDTMIMPTLAGVAADALFLGMPDLGINREELGIKDTGGMPTFLRDQAQPNLYDQLRAELKREANGEGIYFSKEVMDTNTFKQYIDGACKKACLLAHGYAELAFVPASLRGAALWKAQGIPYSEMPEEQRNNAAWSRCIMVRTNIVWPVTTYYKKLKSGGTVLDHSKPNDDATLIYLSDRVAKALYAQKFDHIGEGGLERDEHGMLLGLKPASRETGGSQDQTATGTSGTAPATGKEGGPAIAPEYQRLKDIFYNAKELPGDRSPVMGALAGIWNGLNNAYLAGPEHVSVDVLRVIALIARDAAYIAGDKYSKENPPPFLAKAFADANDAIGGHFRYRNGDSDSKVVEFTPQIGNWKAKKPVPVNGEELTIQNVLGEIESQPAPQVEQPQEPAKEEPKAEQVAQPKEAATA